MIAIIRVIAACFLYSITRSNGEHAHLTDKDTIHEAWMKELEENGTEPQHTPTGKLYDSVGEKNPTDAGVYVFAGEQTILGADKRPNESGAYVSTGEQIPIDPWITNLGVGGVEQMPTSIGGYGCVTHSLVNPCEKVNEYDILPLLPTCKQYVICQDRKLEHILSCADGRLFDHRVKKCLIEDMVDCPCQEKFSPSEATDDGAKDQWYDISSSGTKYEWITDKYDQIDKNKGSQSNALADSNKEIMHVASGITDTAAMANDNIDGNNYPTFYPTFYPSLSPDNTNSKSGKKPNKSAALKTKSSSSIDTATDMPTFVPSGIYSPTMQSQATGVPSILNSPTVAPSVLSDTATPSTIYTPTLSTIARTVAPVIVTNRPSTIFPPYVMISKNPTTDEPTSIRITNRPNTSPPLEIVLPSKRPTKAPTQQPNECVSESEIYNTKSDSIFPISPWTTTGDDNWTIYTNDTPTEAAATTTKAWIQSPNLTGSTTTAIANASVTTCETYLGGTMSITVLANVLPPTDVFIIYIDGIETVQLIDVDEWSLVSVDISPGSHEIDLSYQYNIFSVDPLPLLSSVGGEVFINNVTFTETFTTRGTDNQTTTTAMWSIQTLHS